MRDSIRRKGSFSESFLSIRMRRMHGILPIPVTLQDPFTEDRLTDLRIRRPSNGSTAKKELTMGTVSVPVPNGANLSGKTVSKAILSTAIPTGIGLLASSCYHLLNAWFVSMLDPSAAAAVGITFALPVLLQAIGYWFGTGGGSLLSKLLGAKKETDAKGISSLSFTLSFLTGSCITVLGLGFQVSLLRLLGASEAILNRAQSYWNLLLWSAPAVCSNFTLSQLLRAQGCAKFGMFGLLFGYSLNMLLDPLLIFAFSLGIIGSALAQVLSQWITLLLFLWIYRKRNVPVSDLRMFPKETRKPIVKILLYGLPSLLRQGSTFVSTLLTNRAAAQLGGSAIHAMSVVNRVFLLVFSVCAGIGQGMMTVVGYAYGADNAKTAKKAFRFAWIGTTVTMGLIGLPLFLFAGSIYRGFCSAAEDIAFGTTALRAQMAVLVLHGWITCSGMYLQAIGKPIRASLITCARQGSFFLPLIFWLPNRFGATALLFVQPIADICTFFLAMSLLLTSSCGKSSFASRCRPRTKES